MKTIKEYLNRNKFENKINNIIFDLDEESYNLLDDEFIKILESNNYILSYNMIFEALRVLYKSNDGDELKISNHANERRNRPIEQGGDGKQPIKQNEIINMFRWVWDDIIDMDLDGKLSPFEYNQRLVNSWVLECQCWLKNNSENEIVCTGARPKNMTLWGVWLTEGNGKKLDIIIKTIFRGERLKHSYVQERLKIKTNGNIEQIYKKI